MTEESSEADYNADLLGADGPFVRNIDTFQPRDAQQQLAAAVATAIAEKSMLVAEAPTGVGKTFAYLVPALTSGKKIIVSTATRNLQDQLANRDVPMVRQMLEAGGDVTQLKGRANYLCRYRLDRAYRQPGLLATDRRGIDKVAEFAEASNSGDLTQLTTLSERSPIWREVTSTADNCLGTDCDFYEDCFVVKARRRAQRADLVVVNHHLLFADMTLKAEGMGEILSDADAIILDEAHQVPRIAGMFFSESLTSRSLYDLIDDIKVETGALEQDRRDAVEESARALSVAVAKTRDSVAGSLAQSSRRDDWSLDEVDLKPLGTALDQLLQTIEPLAQKNDAIASCSDRGDVLKALLDQLRGDAREGWVHWAEGFERGFAIHTSPVDVSGPFQTCLATMDCAWIFTSATLAVGDNCDHFKQRLGIESADCLVLDSPFDYPRQAVLYLPHDIPLPSAQDFADALVEQALPLLRAARGRAFMLFTSHRVRRQAAGLLSAFDEFELFVQGDAPRSALLDGFRRSDNGVLLGVASFWEGVDVAGSDLVLVIIDKLPFAPPGDPLTRARHALIEERGDNAFFHDTLPSAVVSLKQGAGRLIRSTTDKGVLMIGDQRLLTKNYGQTFLASLPPMAKSRDGDGVARFLTGL